MKKISHLSYLIIMILSLAIPMQIFAQETNPVDENNMANIASNQLAVSTLEYEPTSSRCKLHYKKSQVKTYNVWSSKKEFLKISLLMLLKIHFHPQRLLPSVQSLRG